MPSWKSPKTIPNLVKFSGCVTPIWCFRNCTLPLESAIQLQVWVAIIDPALTWRLASCTSILHGLFRNCIFTIYSSMGMKLVVYQNWSDSSEMAEPSPLFFGNLHYDLSISIMWIHMIDSYQPQRLRLLGKKPRWNFLFVILRSPHSVRSSKSISPMKDWKIYGRCKKLCFRSSGIHVEGRIPKHIANENLRWIQSKIIKSYHQREGSIYLGIPPYVGMF